MKILITGSNGLLGQKIVYALAGKTGFDVLATSKGENRIHLKTGYRYHSLDITNQQEVEGLFGTERPDCIINTAAMTNVDACEADREGCLALNVNSVDYMLKASQSFSPHFIHLSTDFVFNGASGPYSEEDQPDPQSYYAWSKLESERLVQESGIDWAILRTIIIYGVVDDVQRSNLVLWTKSSLEQNKSINVITDQFRSPTLAEDLAAACIAAAEKRAKGIYHICGPEEDLDSIINLALRVADFFNLDKSLIKPITTAELNQAAKRPLRTGFILDKARRELGYHPHNFTEGLRIVSSQLQQKS